MDQGERRKYLLKELLKEDVQYKKIQAPVEEEEQKQLLRALMNVRCPGRISKEFLEIQDEYLREETLQKGITDVNELNPVKTLPGGGQLYLWQGDITTLRCDAIVNAANSGMTGCYVPNHRCIDNCIHSFAGIQMRWDCARLMERQGYAEPTGRAKITSAYNLPCRYVIHTVGPIIRDELTEQDDKLLASCYCSCLQLASEQALESVAFCCISTGEFHFPNENAAEIAVSTVSAFMNQSTSVKRVVFNVFRDQDREIYERLFG